MPSFQILSSMQVFKQLGEIKEAIKWPIAWLWFSIISSLVTILSVMDL